MQRHLVVGIILACSVATAHAGVHWGTISNGKFYHVSPAPYGYLDENGRDQAFTSGTKLTDEARGASWPLDGWMGWLAQPVTIVLDLGSPYAVSDAHLGLASMRPWGIGFPANVTISTSLDGASWTAYGTSAVPADPASNDWATATASVSGWVNARYVRYALPATSVYTFIDEIWVNGSVVDTAKHVPSTYYLGAYPATAAGNIDNVGPSTAGTTEQSTGCMLDMVLWYEDWVSGFNVVGDVAWLLDTVLGNRLLQVGFLPSQATAAQIAAGNYDSFLRDWFTGLSHRSEPVWIRPMNEMNGCWTNPCAPNCGGGSGCPAAYLQYGRDPQAYRRAWRRMYNIAEQVGATGPNQIFVWSPSPNQLGANPQDPNDPGSLASYYPGAQYVDWVGISGYGLDGGPTLDSMLAQIDTPYGNDKPLMIAEGGTIQTAPTDRVTWVNSWFDALRTRPHLKAAVWYNQQGNANDLSNDPSTLAAYSRGCHAR